MKRFIQTAGCLALFSCFSFAFAQSSIDIKPSILDEVKASNWIKTPEDFNLRGKVKHAATAMDEPDQTSLVVRFNDNGHLIYEKRHNQLSEYSFERDVLKEVKLASLDYDSSYQILHFNAKGQLESKEITFKREGEKRKITVSYSYEKRWEKISLDYDYDYDISHWDVVLSDEYTLKFDSLDRVSVIHSKSHHPETTYGATKRYGYDPQSGKLVHVSFIDDNAGSNSALSLILGIQYNDEDSTFIESMVDYTVRNSMWSYGYSVKKRINRFGEVVVVKTLETQPPIIQSPSNESTPEDTTPSPKISYSIDSNGNWTEQVTILHSGEKKVVKRSIEYY